MQGCSGFAPASSEIRRRPWKLILREAGERDARLHNARHTATTVLLLGVHERGHGRDGLVQPRHAQAVHARRRGTSTGRGRSTQWVFLEGGVSPLSKGPMTRPHGTPPSQAGTGRLCCPSESTGDQQGVQIVSWTKLETYCRMRPLIASAHVSSCFMRLAYATRCSAPLNTKR